MTAKMNIQSIRFIIMHPLNYDRIPGRLAKKDRVGEQGAGVIVTETVTMELFSRIFILFRLILT
ncbi:hypothetical protein J42TS3_17440 [Paenibacillus vini]|uniref:Uncharacterized protein n=1 Tax=Paenibacillus vini TaxID=1476024 RepID=A0ABQ4M9N4_9BACL|nr:hypothetical protein J42TS3_17440 [Paenibacillus vini]